VFEHGDTITDGGNSNYREDIRHATALEKRGIHYVDAGTSGGVWGFERGCCLMVDGETDVVDRLADQLLSALRKGFGGHDEKPD
jgi:6-phosphogluconate dehydrogenase